MPRALVTGGAGFIGSHLVDRLLAENFSVRVLDDFSSGHEANLTQARGVIELLHGDIRDSALVAAAVDGVDVVFHEAAIASVVRSIEEPERTNAVNLDGTLQLLCAARAAGVRRVVCAVSSAVYGNAEERPKREESLPNPLSPYAFQKYAVEVYSRLFTELYGLETVCLRYFNVYGPRQDPKSEYAAVVPRFLAACLAEESPHIFGDGEQTRDFVFVDDVVEANWLAARAPGAVGLALNVASGRETSLNQLFEVIQELLDSKLVPVHEPPRVGDVRRSVASLERTSRALGYVPRTDLRQGLARTLESLRSWATPMTKKRGTAA